MNLINTLKSAAAISAIALSFVSTSSFAATADGPLSLRTCTVKGNCEPPDPNGPSLDGFAIPAPAGAMPGRCYNDRDGLEGFAVAAGVRQNGCHDMNGPSLNGFSDLTLGTVIIAIDKP